MTCQNISDIALEAYSTIPFYRWAYNNKGSSGPMLRDRKVPVISKRDFFAYEDDKGKPYYDGVLGPSFSDDITMALTSGTSGKPLSVPIRHDSRIVIPLKLALARIIQSEMKIAFPAEGPEYLTQIIRSFKQAGVLTYVIPTTEPLEEQIAVLSAGKPQIILDISNSITRSYLTNNIPLLKLGVKYILNLITDSQIKAAWEQRGITFYSFYTSIDSMVPHIGCPRSRPNTFHIYSKDSIHEVLRNDGQITQTGPGKYVSTIPWAPFPLIRYTNDDIVEITSAKCGCGFEGYDLRYIKRDQGIKLKYLNGPIINYQEIYNTLSIRKEFGRVLIMNVEFPHHDENYLITFVEQDIDRPVLKEEMWKEVMLIGTGAAKEWFAQFVPVIAVPKGTLPIEKRGFVKEKAFIDCSTGSIPATYAHIVEIFCKLTGRKVN